MGRVYFFQATSEDFHYDELDELAEIMEKQLKEKGIENPLVIITSGLIYRGETNV